MKTASLTGEITLLSRKAKLTNRKTPNEAHSEAHDETGPPDSTAINLEMQSPGRDSQMKNTNIV
jgi:hypothetical protein